MIAMVSKVIRLTPISASAENSAIMASRPFRISAPTTRRRSSRKTSSASIFGHGVPVAGREVRLEALVGTWLAAFSSRGAGRLSSSNRASAASRSASSKISQRLIRSPSTVKNRDLSPLGVEALLRGPLRRMGDDRSEVAQPMHGLDVDVESGARSHVARTYAVSVTGRERCWRAGGRCSPSPGSFAEIRAG